MLKHGFCARRLDLLSRDRITAQHRTVQYRLPFVKARRQFPEVLHYSSVIMQLFYAVVASGFAQIVCSLAFHVLFATWTTLGARASKEMRTNPAIRPMTDLRMGLYCPFMYVRCWWLATARESASVLNRVRLCCTSLPFVNAALLACAFVVFDKSIDHRAFNSVYMAGAQFGGVLWAVGPAHGILIDWCMYKTSINIPMLFLVATFLQYLVNGAVVASFLVAV